MAKRRAEMRADASDYGPSVIRQKDGRMRFQGAADVILETRPDPDITARVQLVRGARRSITITELFTRGVITKPQHDAANRFLDDLSWATTGGGGGVGDGIRVTPGSRDAMPQRQLEAIGRVSKIRVLLGLNTDAVLWWVLIGNKATTEFDRRFKLREGTGAIWLRKSLNALDEFYN